jgi:hypothetical protein
MYGEGPMTAYTIVQNWISSESTACRHASDLKFGGKHVRGGTVELFESHPEERRIACLFSFDGSDPAVMQSPGVPWWA